VMSYLSLRFRVYQHSVKTTVAALAELLTFLMMVLYLAIPAIVFTALVSLSIIEDIREPVSTQALYQGLYLAVTYLLVRIQKRAILGGDSQLYFATLPTSKLVSSLTTTILTAIAGNLPLLVPLFLLTYVNSTEQLIQHAHFALFGVTTLVTAAYCISRKRLPVVTGVFVLAVALVNEISSFFPSLVAFNTCLLLVLIAEYFAQKTLEHKECSSLKLRTKAYWQLRAMYMSRTPATMIMRLTLLCIFVALIAFMQTRLSQVASIEIQLICCYVIGLLIGSQQFEHQTFKQKYHYFLALEHISLRRCLIQETVFTLVVALILSYVMIVGLDFEPSMLFYAPLMALTTALSVIWINKSFFIPSAFLTLAFVTLHL